MSESTLRVLHITEMLSAAGIESFIMNMYRNIDRNKVQFDFLVLRNQKEFYDDEVKKLGGRKYYVHSKKNNTWMRILDEANQIEKFLKENHYDIVHIHYTTPLRAPYLLAAKKAGVGTRIYHAHSAAISGKSKLKMMVYEYYRKKIIEWGTDWFGCSRAAAEWIFPQKYVDSDKVKVVYNGIDTKRFKYNVEKRREIRAELGIADNFLLVHTGRFIDQKNQGFVLDVFKVVKQKNPDAKMVFLGTGNLLNEIEQKAEMLGIKSDVFFLGVKENVQDYLSAADCYIMPSLYEGLPVAAVEAQCSGLPCVMSANITKEVALTKATCFLSLDESVDVWADEVLKYRNAIKFSNEESKQTYAISIKVPAIQVEFRRMLPFEDDNGGKLSYTLNGTLYPDEQVVIYDIGDVKPETEKKRRGRRKKSEIEAEQKEN